MSHLKIYLLLVGVLIVSTVSVIPAVTAAVQVNIWSLGYARYTLAEGIEGNGTAPIPPRAHQRASLWLARKALSGEDPKEAIKLVQLLADEGNQDALMILGNSLAAAGDFIGAVEAWKGAGEYSILLQAAWQAKEEGRIQDALLSGRAACGLNPEKGTLSLAIFTSDAGDLETAILLLHQILDEYPRSAQRQAWLLQLGDTYRKQKSWDDAIDFYRQILYEQPRNIFAHIGMGWVYYERGDGLELALGEFHQVVALAPERGDGYYAIGQVLAREQSYAVADDWFVKAIKCNPENRWWRLERANNLRTAGSFSVAMQLYTEIMGRFPNWSQVYYEIAWANKFDNNPGEAIQAIEKAIMLEQQQNFWYFWRAGKIYEWADKPEEAKATYRQALSLSPENQAARQAFERLTNTDP